MLNPKPLAKFREISFLRNFKVLGLIGVVLITVIHFPVLFHQFQSKWDDQWVVVNDYTSSGLNFINIYLIFGEFYHGQYAPINQLYYTIIHSLFGYSSLAYHLSGLLIHIFNTYLVYRLLLKIFVIVIRDKHYSPNRAALISALIFGVHPVLVESIDWVSASKILIYSCFYLISLLSYLSYISTNEKKYYWFTFISFIISFGAKEQAVVLPLCLILFDFISLRTQNRYVWAEKIPFFIVALAFGIVTLYSQKDVNQGALSDGGTYPMTSRVVFACYAYLEYLTKCILPYKLSYIYPFPSQIGEPIPTRFMIYPFVILIIVVCFWTTFKRRIYFFATLFFTIHIVIVLHIIPIARFTIVADRYVYVSSIAVFAMLGYYFDRSFKSSHAGTIAKVICCLYIVYLSVYTNLRSQVWRDSNALKLEMRNLLQIRNRSSDPTHK